MKNDDELRGLLRDADPAKDRELPPVDRARMRAVITSSALDGRSRRSPYRWLAVGAALAMAAIAFFVFMPRGERPMVVTEAPPKREPPPIPAPAIPVAATPTPTPTLTPVTATKAVPPKTQRRQPAPLDEASATTRIVFTAPEGTKIHWFVSTPTPRS